MVPEYLIAKRDSMTGRYDIDSLQSKKIQKNIKNWQILDRWN